VIQIVSRRHLTELATRAAQTEEEVAAGSEVLARLLEENGRLAEQLRTADPALQARLRTAEETIRRQAEQLATLQAANEAHYRDLYDRTHPAVPQEVTA
jgi:flagellar motility protein MotE (MotC chaperone)